MCVRAAETRETTVAEKETTKEAEKIEIGPGIRNLERDIYLRKTCRAGCARIGIRSHGPG